MESPINKDSVLPLVSIETLDISMLPKSSELAKVYGERRNSGSISGSSFRKYSYDKNVPDVGSTKSIESIKMIQAAIDQARSADKLARKSSKSIGEERNYVVTTAKELPRVRSLHMIVASTSNKDFQPGVADNGKVISRSHATLSTTTDEFNSTSPVSSHFQSSIGSPNPLNRLGSLKPIGSQIVNELKPAERQPSSATLSIISKNHRSSPSLSNLAKSTSIAENLDLSETADAYPGSPSSSIPSPLDEVASTDQVNSLLQTIEKTKSLPKGPTEPHRRKMSLDSSVAAKSITYQKVDPVIQNVNDRRYSEQDNDPELAYSETATATRHHSDTVTKQKAAELESVTQVKVLPSKIPVHDSKSSSVQEVGPDREVTTSYTESLDNMLQQSYNIKLKAEEEFKNRLSVLKEAETSSLERMPTPKTDVKILSPLGDTYDEDVEVEENVNISEGHKFESMNFIQFRSADILYEPKKKVPKFIGRYVLGDCLGEGSYGKVKEGYSIDTLRRVAVKIMKHAKLKKIPGGEQNVKRELSIQKRLHHKNIVELMDVLIKPEKQKIYMVFEYCAGTLQDLMERAPERKLVHSQTQRYFIQIVNGLQYLHSNSIIHRDIKPGNILITFDETIKISDFGVSEELPRYEDDDTCITSQGSPAFQPPEVAAGVTKFSGIKADIWAIGVTLYNMISGSYPFDGDSIYSLFENIAKGEFQLPKEASNPFLKDLLTAILAKNPVERATVYQIKQHPWLNIYITNQTGEIPVIAYESTESLNGASDPVSSHGSSPKSPRIDLESLKDMNTSPKDVHLGDSKGLSPLAVHPQPKAKTNSIPFISNPHFAYDTTLIPYLETIFEDLKHNCRRSSLTEVNIGPRNRGLPRRTVISERFLTRAGRTGTADASQHEDAGTEKLNDNGQKMQNAIKLEDRKF